MVLSLCFRLHLHRAGQSENFVQPTIMGDRGWLHLEARYNYESLRDGSVLAWVQLQREATNWLWEFTPMIGGVVGDTAGVAPATEPYSATGSSNSQPKENTFSTPAIRQRAFSTTGRS